MFCNNFGSNSEHITLDIISNDVCVEVVAGSIGDYIWHDNNADAVQDASETPLQNVGVKLLVNDGAGNYVPFQIPDPANPGTLIDYVTTTDTSGGYLFENLPSGDYRVMVDTATLPPGATQTFDDNSGLDDMSDVALFGPNYPEDPDNPPSDVDNNHDQDFGYDFPIPDIALTKTTPSTGVYINTDVTFTVEVFNQGEIDLTNIVVADYIPAGYTLSDPTDWYTDATLTTPATAGTTGTVYTNITGPLPTGDSLTVSITLTVIAGADQTNLVNRAEIFSFENIDGVGITGYDPDSVADDNSNNDPGGTVNTAEDNHIDDNSTDSDGNGITDEDDSDPATVVLLTPGASIDIEKYTNNVDSDQAPGETLTTGDRVTWTYIVTNTGTTALTDATVTDDQETGITCDIDANGTFEANNTIPLLLPGQTITCQLEGTATQGNYLNTGSVTATPVIPNPETCGCDLADPTTWPTNTDLYQPAQDNNGDPLTAVTDTDPSHHTSQPTDNNTNGDSNKPERSGLALTGTTSKTLTTIATLALLLGAFLTRRTQKARRPNAT